jgi:hypothetical protein
MAEDEANPTVFVAPTLEELEPLFRPMSWRLSLRRGEWGQFTKPDKNLWTV